MQLHNTVQAPLPTAPTPQVADTRESFALPTDARGPLPTPALCPLPWRARASTPATNNPGPAAKPARPAHAAAHTSAQRARSRRMSLGVTWGRAHTPLPCRLHKKPTKHTPLSRPPQQAAPRKTAPSKASAAVRCACTGSERPRSARPAAPRTTPTGRTRPPASATTYTRCTCRAAPCREATRGGRGWPGAWHAKRPSRERAALR